MKKGFETFKRIKADLDSVGPKEVRYILIWLIGNKLLPTLEPKDLAFFANLFTEEELKFAKRRNEEVLV